jgi:pimeloyl-ACP methyl ester carboxylesterase
MNSESHKNVIYQGANGREALLDFEVPDNWNKQVLIFMHGFMGFKDWGCWHLMERYFIAAGYAFCKFNVSHNGTTKENTTTFSDIKAFSENSYTKELEDLNKVIDWVDEKTHGLATISVIGHSRGGGIAILAGRNSKLKRIIALAAISDIESRFPSGQQLALWQEKRLLFVHNGRTKQDLPMKYAQYVDFQENKEQLTIETNCKERTTPLLIIHGSKDQSVLPYNAQQLAQWSGTSAVIIEGASHTFGAAHPWKSNEMPGHLIQACEQIIGFTKG